MTRFTFAQELEKAADQIAELSRTELQVMLRRAALRLRNIESIGLDADADQAVDFMAAEMNVSRPQALRTIIREWLISDGRLPVESETEKRVPASFDDSSERLHLYGQDDLQHWHVTNSDNNDQLPPI